MSRRLSSCTDTILLDCIFVQIQAQARKVGQVDVTVLDAKYVRRSHQFQSRSPLLLGKIGAADDFLQLAITHRATCLDVSGERERSRSMLDAGHAESLRQDR